MRKKDVVITTILGRGSVCEGDFQAEGSVRVDGTVNGNVTATGMVILGATGSVCGGVNASAVVVGGEVNGNINAPEKVELTASARVFGDIITGTIIIDEKAVFQGRCDMNQEPSVKRPKVSGRIMRGARKSAKAAVAEALKEVEAERNQGNQEEEKTVVQATEAPSMSVKATFLESLNGMQKEDQSSDSMK